MMKREAQITIIEGLRRAGINQIFFKHGTDELILTLKPDVDGERIAERTQLTDIRAEDNRQMLNIGTVEMEDSYIIFHGGRMNAEDVVTYIREVVLMDVISAYRMSKGEQ